MYSLFPYSKPNIFLLMGFCGIYLFICLHVEFVYTCRDCAHEYEKRQEMAAAALAYKCMEVAYMRIVYCKNSSTNRDRQDLQTSLQMVPQGINEVTEYFWHT